MFDLSRYFLRLSFILVVLAAGLLGPLYQKLSLRQLEEQAESRNVALAKVFHNSLQRQLESVLDTAATDAGDIRAYRLSMALQELMRGTSVVKVKVYSREGEIVFSTDGRGGETKPESNPGFLSAVSGEVSSELTRRNTFDAFEGMLADVDLLSSYIPIVASGNNISGVFELYQNVTPFVRDLDRSSWWMAGIVALVFSVLYLLQYLVVRRAHGIIQDQDGQLRAARDTLEIQVAERTEELTQANGRLETEIAERRRTQEKLNYLAHHDPLTGLENRRSFTERLAESLRRSRAADERLAVLFIDLDQFKQVNDSLGHVVGDELLVAVGRRLAEEIPPGTQLARLGGDEFICLMEAKANDGAAEGLAQRIVAAFATPFHIGHHELFLNTSVGISLFPEDGETGHDLMRNADTAMYRAKATGRGRYHFYTPEMTQAAHERIRLENHLRRAIERGELRLQLQAQVDTVGRQLVGAEALLRWHSPELGEVSPERFIPVVEESGLIVELGHWVLAESCRQVVAWRRGGFAFPKISVNISARQLEHPDFVERLMRILTETEMDPGALKLELTESVVMATDDSLNRLKKLRELGIGLALDDFGTGYSSLSYLRQLPIQQLKIDQSFVAGIGRNPDDESIVRAIMELARSLRFEVVAEGVETAAQAAFLAELGCRYLQGYLYGKPLAPDEFRERWMQAA